MDDRNDLAFGRSAHIVVGRLRYDVFSESYIGLIMTDRELMNGHSRVGGIDSQFRFGRNHRFASR